MTTNKSKPSQIDMKALGDLSLRPTKAGGMDIGGILPTLKETMEQLGNAAQAKILGEMVGGIFGAGGRGNGGGSSSIKDVTAALKDLHEISAGREEAYRKQLSDLEGKSSKADHLSVEMEKVGIQRDKSMSDVILSLMDRQDKQKDSSTNEITMLLFKHMLEQQQELMRELRESRKPKEKESDEEGLLKKLGLDYLQGALNRNPREEYEHERDYWEKRIGPSTGITGNQQHDLAMFKIKKELELEERKWEREQKKVDMEERNKGELYKAMFAALGAIKGGKGLGIPPAMGETVGVPPGAQAVQCPSCHNPIMVEQLEPNMTCPYCQAELSMTDSGEELPRPIKPPTELVM